MAKLTVKGLDDYALAISKLGDRADDVAKKAIYAGAKIIADKAKQNLENVLSGDSTGDSVESFGVTPISQDKDGNWNCKIGFDGYDRSGTPNQLKARVLESGSSKQKKRPYMRPAVRAKKQEAIKAMGDIIDTEIQKQMK